MEPFEFIDPWYYSTFYFCIALVLSWMTVLYYLGSNDQKLLHAEGSPMQGVATILSFLVALFIGLRQLTQEFGDTRGYAAFYNHPIELHPVDLHSEWLWYNLQVFCKYIGMNVHEFFFFVALVYVGGMFICALMLTKKNLWISMVFFLTAFQFFTYGTNGIRNGFACSVELIALALVSGSKAKRIIGFILMFAAMSIHRSTLIPTAGAIASLYFVKDTKTSLRFWVASIGISLVAGPVVEQMIVSLGLDGRMSSYSAGQNNESVTQYFSNTGFRWDFLLYSACPVAMIWYATRFRKFNSPEYTIIANSYLLANAFWIMVIRAAFSNRFAYLSWFIIPMVFAYPLLRMNLWKDQDRKTALILFFYTGFTFFMFFIYYFGTTGFNGFNQYWWKK